MPVKKATPQRRKGSKGTHVSIATPKGNERKAGSGSEGPVPARKPRRKSPFARHQPIALIMSKDKTGITGVAGILNVLGWGIIGTTGTVKLLRENSIQAVDIAEFIGGGAILGGRVKSISRQIAAGLLSKSTAEDIAEIARLRIPRIDLVLVGLYPLVDEIKREGSTVESVIEETDVGGILALHAAAKGQRIVLTNVRDFHKYVAPSLKDGRPPEEVMQHLMSKSWAVCGHYLASAAQYHSAGHYAALFGERVGRPLKGENGPQSPAALYRTFPGVEDPLAISNFRLIEGADLSYNNICDLDRALQTATHMAAGFEVNLNIVPEIALGLKHGNSCGAGAHGDRYVALHKMLMGDRQAVFGATIMATFEIDEAAANILLWHGTAKKRILDVIIAPAFSDAAIALLKRKGDKCRLVVNPALRSLSAASIDTAPRFRMVRGGFLTEPNYTKILRIDEMRRDAGTKLTPEAVWDLVMAIAICQTGNSNQVCAVKNGMLLVNATNQKARVQCVRLAISLAEWIGHKLEGAAWCSDSFFPFDDGPKLIAAQKPSVVFTTTGSVNDEDMFAAFRAGNVPLLHLPDSEARMFGLH